MFQDLPKRCSERDLMEEIGAVGGADCVDFLFLPWQGTARNMGYAFVNFTGRAADVVERLHGRAWKQYPNAKAMKIVPSEVQGLVPNLAKAERLIRQVRGQADFPSVFLEGKRVAFNDALRLFCPDDFAHRPPGEHELLAQQELRSWERHEQVQQQQHHQGEPPRPLREVAPKKTTARDRLRAARRLPEGGARKGPPAQPMPPPGVAPAVERVAEGPQDDGCPGRGVAAVRPPAPFELPTPRLRGGFDLPTVSRAARFVLALDVAHSGDGFEHTFAGGEPEAEVLQPFFKECAAAVSF